MSEPSDLINIRDIVGRHLRKRGPIADDTRLVSGGLIDSMSIVDLILDLQSELGVTIPTSEVQPDDFDSVVAIARTIARFR
jgi:acyl carrier protein